MAIEFFDTFEHGVAPTLAGGGFWDNSIVTPGAFSISTSVFKHGSRSLRLNPASTAAQIKRNRASGKKVLVVDLWYREDAYDTSGAELNAIVECNDSNGDSFGMDIAGASGSGTTPAHCLQTAYYDNGLGGVFNRTAGPFINLNQWYHIQITWDASTSTWATTWCVDGVDQSASTYARSGYIVASDVVSWQLGWTGTFAADRYYDTVVMGDTQATDYKLAELTGTAVSPASVGTHSLDAATSIYFFKNDNTTETALTTSETTSYQMVDEVPLDANSATPDRLLIKLVQGASSFIDPTGDGAAVAWTKSTGTTAWNLLDDAVRQPTAPSTGTDDITGGTTAGTAQGVSFPNTLTYDPTATYTVWVYGKHGNRTGWSVAISIDNSTFGTDTTMVAAATPAGSAAWFSQDITSLITGQTALDGLQVRFKTLTIAGGSPTASEIDACYLEAKPAPASPGATRYTEHGWAAYSGNAPVAVRAITGLRNDSGTTPNSITAKLAQSGSEANIVSGIDIASASVIYKTAVFVTEPAGAAWTQALVNATKLRWGYTANAASTPRLEAAMLEVLAPAAAGATAPPGRPRYSMAKNPLIRR